MEQAVTDSVVSAAQPRLKRKGILWKWSLVATVLFFTYLSWELGSGFIAGAGPSDEAVRRFHSQLDSRDYEGVLQESDEGFQNSERREEFLKVLAGIHSKMGVLRVSTRTNISVNISASGTLVKPTYQSTFERGDATEMFTWRKTIAGDLSLRGYDISSNVFITK